MFKTPPSKSLNPKKKYVKYPYYSNIFDEYKGRFRNNFYFFRLDNPKLKKITSEYTLVKTSSTTNQLGKAIEQIFKTNEYNQEFINF